MKWETKWNFLRNFHVNTRKKCPDQYDKRTWFLKPLWARVTSASHFNIDEASDWATRWWLAQTRKIKNFDVKTKNEKKSDIRFKLRIAVSETKRRRKNEEKHHSHFSHFIVAFIFICFSYYSFFISVLGLIFIFFAQHLCFCSPPPPLPQKKNVLHSDTSFLFHLAYFIFKHIKESL